MARMAATISGIALAGASLVAGRDLGRGAAGHGGARRLFGLHHTQVFDVDEPLAGHAEGFGCLLLADAIDVQALFADARGQPGEVAVRRHQDKAVEQAGMQEIHRRDHQADVGGVLALGVGKLLVGDQAQGGHLARPGRQALRRPVAVDAADRGFAQAGDFFEDCLGIAGGHVVGVDQDGQAGGAGVGGHGVSFASFWQEAPGQSRKKRSCTRQ
jgi:hypothetical protein